MDWQTYWRIVRRRWWLIAVILLLDVVVAGFLFRRSYRTVGYQGSVTLYVADVSSPSVTLETTDQLLAGETAGNFFADDILDVAQSDRVAAYVAHVLSASGLPGASLPDVQGAVNGARKDRTVTLTVTNASSSTALAEAGALGRAMTSQRSRFIGSKMAKRTFVTVISGPSVGRAPASRQLVNFALRVFLGLLVALGLALVWDALDPRVRDRRDVEAALGSPVLVEAQ